MGHLPTRGLSETKYSTLQYRFRCAEPMFKARFSVVHRFCVYFIVFSMVGATVFGFPLRSNSQTGLDHQDVVPAHSFSPDNFSTFSDSVTETSYEFITVTEVVTDLVEVEVLTTEPLGSTTQSLEPNTDEEKEKTDADERIQKQLLENGCSLLNRTAYPQKKLRRIKRTRCGTAVVLVSKSAYFLRIVGRYVSWEHNLNRGTDVEILPANGPTLVRINVVGSNRYLKMDDAGLLSAVSLTDQELLSNVGPTVWIQRVAPGQRTAFNFYQNKGNNVKWFLRAGDSPVQTLNSENDNTRFYYSTCNG